jgi:signal peptidase I
VTVRRLIRELVLPIATALALTIVVQAAVAKPYTVPTGSMEPTIMPGDRILANRAVYRFRQPRRGDIVVFTPTESARASCPSIGGDAVLVKRLIGLPGDVVEVVGDGPTLVNGRLLRVAAARPNPAGTRRRWRVPAGKLFMMGDNRPDSCDSRSWGDPFVPRGNVQGQAEAIYWPPRRVGLLR